MSRYWVVGGEYADTNFRSMAKGQAPVRLGPFASYDEAKRAWQAQSWANVDSCHHRFTIVSDEGLNGGSSEGAVAA